MVSELRGRPAVRKVSPRVAVPEGRAWGQQGRVREGGGPGSGLHTHGRWAERGAGEGWEGAPVGLQACFSPAAPPPPAVGSSWRGSLSPPQLSTCVTLTIHRWAPPLPGPPAHVTYKFLPPSADFQGAELIPDVQPRSPFLRPVPSERPPQREAPTGHTSVCPKPALLPCPPLRQLGQKLGRVSTFPHSVHSILNPLNSAVCWTCPLLCGIPGLPHPDDLHGLHVSLWSAPGLSLHCSGREDGQGHLAKWEAL